MTNTLRKVGSNLLKVGSALNIWDGTGTPCCCGPTCTLCDGSTPAQMQVDLDGVIDEDGTGCFECDNINGTYVCDLTTTTGSECEWVSPPFDICEVSTVVRVGILNTLVSGQYTLRVQVLQGATMIGEWRESQVAKFVCSAFSAHSVAYFNEHLGPCRFSTGPSTALVTAL